MIRKFVFPNQKLFACSTALDSDASFAVDAYIAIHSCSKVRVPVGRAKGSRGHVPTGRTKTEKKSVDALQEGKNEPVIYPSTVPEPASPSVGAKASVPPPKSKRKGKKCSDELGMKVHSATNILNGQDDGKGSSAGSSSLSSSENISEFRRLVLSYPLFSSSASYSATQKLIAQLTQKPKVPGVTVVLKDTMPPDRAKILKAWEEKMVKKLGTEGFALYKTELFSTGHKLHHYIETKLKGLEAEEVDTAIAGHMKSLEGLLGRISDVQILESRFRHPVFGYEGIVDCIARYRGHLVLIDWKTSQRPRYRLEETYDNPVQLAAYLGLVNSLDVLKCASPIKQGLIVCVYPTGYPATVLVMSQKAALYYWQIWLNRLCDFWERPAE